jgi:hypothetical protein
MPPAGRVALRDLVPGGDVLYPGRGQVKGKRDVGAGAFCFTGSVGCH